ncbi:MAG: methyl-viologen-reducing hydrogenase delta subunit [Anaerolineaceae bacterium]|nr:MAG: methyl-viologen-reducing hydrogenase delta subunit [Anaerolineaceae bacterium]
MNYEPRIIAFLCTWCSYTGADTAGIARMKSPANIRAIRVPCSGRVSPELVMRAFDQGADGVLVLGCHIGECHYETGNHRAAKRLPILRSLMVFAGLEPERLHLDWVSASEGERFSKIATEFTDKVRGLGPVHWHIQPADRQALEAKLATVGESIPCPEMNCADKTDAIRAKARELLEKDEVGVVIGYEVGPRGRTRPYFAYTPEETEHLVWNPDCSHNLTRYLPIKLRPVKGKENPKPVAVVVKPCDSKAINVMMAENQYRRDQVHVLGVTCEGIRTLDGNLQTRCIACQESVPIVCDTLIGEATTPRPPLQVSCCETAIAELENTTPTERMEFWLSQFDRCIRCYACRQACPMCNCPICLFDRDESTYVGLGIGVNEKRTFHLGRAYHLAGRCIGCNECERACPMNIPISLLNQKLAAEIEKSFGHRAGLKAVPSPIVTVLSGEYKEG